ncbi:MAG TPA: GNAT family protein [Flavobacteriales bacterium]|nr:GNAT family protein [Flavobacteriales bacterium]
MKILLTYPINTDSAAFYKLISEDDLQREFSNFRNYTSDDSEAEMDYWETQADSVWPSFMRLIRVTEKDWLPQNTVWNDENSRLVGFISHTETSGIDRDLSGMNYLIGFGLAEWCRGLGIMPIALGMTLQRMREERMNVASCYVKHGNRSSERVLEKCGFEMARSHEFGMTFIKHLI